MPHDPAEELAALDGPDRLPHLPALDGLRGLAVALVVAFHLALVPGGWLGVDVFFVLSGFLITRLLLHERDRTGRTELVGFWRRRARRLLPALVAVLAGVAAYAAWYPEPVLLPADLPGQFVATVAYVANWFQIHAGTGYWDQFATPSPLEHMWSLAIEEQFYLVFPLLAVAVLALVKGRRPAFVGVLVLGALGSWGLALVRLAEGTAFDRVYLGTDTRIGAIFCGAAAGALSVHPPVADRLARAARPLGVPALVGVVVLGIVVDGEVAWSAVRWSLLPLLEVLVAVVLLAATSVERPAASSRLLGLAPLVWLGGISYGLYLWHIPVILTAERAMRDQPRWLVVAVAAAVSLGIAQLSAVALERPIRRHGLAAAPRFTIVVGSVVVLVASYVVVRQATEPARALEGDRPPSSAKVDIAAADPAASGPALRGEAALPLDRPDDRAPRVLLVGDSLAYDLSGGFEAVGAERGLTTSEASFVGCGDGGADRDDDLFNDAAFVARCEAWLADLPTLVEQAQPDVVVLLRASARRTIPGSDVVHDRCEPEWLDWYRDEMADEVRSLAAEGSAVAVATRPYNRFGDVVDDQNDREVDCMNAVLREVADADPSAVLLPINEWVCPTKDACRAEQDGVVLREDGLHFRGEGAELAAGWMFDELYGT